MEALIITSVCSQLQRQNGSRYRSVFLRFRDGKPYGLRATVVRTWMDQRAFALATCAYQLHELRTVCRRTELAKYIAPAQAVRLINPLQALALVASESMPMVDISADPFDKFLPGCAEATATHYLVLSDKADVLAPRRHSYTRIVTLGSFARTIGCA